ncbi:MAG TPA: RnfABCDGE type electron transport complex subunit G [Nitrospirota bacterium]|jgi:electron transport complex protein RnfG
MNDYIKITSNLMIICATAGLILAATWASTEPVKVRKEAQELEQALKGLMPQADSIQAVKDIKIAGKECKIYEAKQGGNLTGFVVSSYGKGYSSYIKLLVAIDANNTVTAVDVLGHAETPGLGDQITEGWFKDRFKGKSLEHLVVVKGDTQTDVQAISGATISSRGVTRGVKDAVEALKAAREGGLK